MPAYNFQGRFAPAVLEGRKAHTVRRRRKVQTKAGDTLTLYTGQRTPNCQFLRRSVCTKVLPLEIHEDGSWYVDAAERWTPQQIAEFVRVDTDGLMTPAEFLEFIEGNYGLPADDLEIIFWEVA